MNLESENNRLQEENKQLRELLSKYLPKEHWATASKSLVSRLRGIYAIGPQADQNIAEFGWREYAGRPPIQHEAAQRISDLEDVLLEVKEELFSLLDD